MRILLLSDAGSIHTARWAAYLTDCGDDVHVATLRPGRVQAAGVHLLPTYHLRRLGYLFAIPILRRLARHLRPDVVHAHYVTSYGFLAAAAGLRPLVLTAWGTDVLLSPWQSRIHRRLARYAVQRADVITAVAEHMVPAIVALGRTRADVSSVPFGVDTTLFRAVRATGEASDVSRIICTRNFYPIYDVETVLAAVHELGRRGVKYYLDLVGDGPLRAALETGAAARGIHTRVTFHGHVAHQRLVGLLAASDIFVSPALSDGNNISLNEAMACGVFPIATDIPANSQWIDHRRNGLLFRSGDVVGLADCLQSVAASPEWRVQAAIENRRIVERYADWHRNAERMRDICERATQQRWSR